MYFMSSLQKIPFWVPQLTGESFWIRSWATWMRFLLSSRHFWNFLLSSSSRRSKSIAASSRAWIKPFQDFKAGTWGATAALMPVPITKTRSWGFLHFRLGRSFLQPEDRREDMSVINDHISLLPFLLGSQVLDSAPLPPPFLIIFLRVR